MAAPTISKPEFRLGEDHISHFSDSDQSAPSERSLSPQTGAKPSKAKKRKARKQVGALTEELHTLLGAAFQAPDQEAAKPNIPDHGNADQNPSHLTMEIDTEKRLSKRTRQNMVKMEKRKLAGQQQRQNLSFPQEAPAQHKPLTVQGQQRQQKQNKKNSTQARRERKEKSRAKRAMGLGDAMAIG
ncbi:hypothetical protein ACEQ8H_004866 [Pleosporales sp. CAS-2024a]